MTILNKVDIGMNEALLFKIAAVGILVSVLSQVLKHSGREEQAFLTSLQHAVHAEGRREAAHGKGQKKAVSRRHTGQQHHPDGGEPQQKCKQRIAEIDHQGRQSRLDSGRSLAPQADVVLQIPPQLVPRGVRHPARQDLSQKDAGQEEQRQQKQAGQRGQLDRGPLRQCSRVQSASPHRILCGGRRIYVAVDVRPCLF